MGQPALPHSKGRIKYVRPNRPIITICLDGLGAIHRSGDSDTHMKCKYCLREFKTIKGLKIHMKRKKHTVKDIQPEKKLAELGEVIIW